MISSDQTSIPKTFMFFKEDIETINKLGITPKHALRMGITAIRDNPQLLERIRELEIANDKIMRKLESISLKYWELKEKMEKKE